MTSVVNTSAADTATAETTTEAKPAKRKRGRPPVKPSELRRHCCAVKLHDAEYRQLLELTNIFAAKYPDGPAWKPTDVLRRGLKVQWQAYKYGVDE